MIGVASAVWGSEGSGKQARVVGVLRCLRAVGAIRARRVAGWRAWWSFAFVRVLGGDE
jgi:hypothetical protein